jgi:hypothetical protein
MILSAALFLAMSVFFGDGVAPEMPRAQAYLVTSSDGAMRLEDRYEVADLWIAREMVGRWMDAEGRVFTVAGLDTQLPAFLNERKSRAQFVRELVPAKNKEKEELHQLVNMLSPVEPAGAKEYTKPRQKPRGYKDVRYYEGTNEHTIVCAYLPSRPGATWALASWELLEDDDIDEKREIFEEEFFEKKLEVAYTNKLPAADLSERELLREGARHSIEAYDNWHFTSSDEYVVLDNLNWNRQFVTEFTNEIPRLRKQYAAAFPSPIEGSNVLCTARIYSKRAEYLEAVAEDMQWSAAYWSPARRELVAYLPEGGSPELMKTIRHEAFHQYLSYATAMISAAPWLNEGYAQYFEDPNNAMWRLTTRDEKPTTDDISRYAELIPLLLKMNYTEFYAGTDAERRLKYRLAWSIAYFLEKGAPLVRFQPFATLRTDYINAVLRTHDRDAATDAAFGSDERLKLFISEWKRFWQNM